MNGFLVFLALSAGTTGQVRGEIPFLLGSDPLPPWVEGTYGPTDQGPGIRMVSDIFSRTGNSIQVVVHPWLRILRMLEFGRLDGILLVQKQERLKPWLLYSDPLFTSRTVICYNTRKHKNFSFQALTDLAPYTLGVVAGQVPLLEQAASSLGLRLEILPTTEAGLVTLSTGRMDLFIGTENSIRSRMETLPNLLFLEIHPTALISQELHIGIAKDSPAAELLPAINESIATMKAEGSLLRYLKDLPDQSAPKGEP